VTARKARRTQSRVLANRMIVAALVVLALGGLYGVAGLSRPMALTSAARASSLGELPVTSALVACPAPGSGGLTGGGVAVASAPAGPGSGKLTLTALGRAAGGQPTAPVLVPTQPGELTVRPVRSAKAEPGKAGTLPAMAGGRVPTSVGRGGLIVSATGADAQGFDVEQLGPDGQPTARCASPGSDFWFVGPGAVTLHTDLYLINTDSQQADANVSVITDSGPLFGLADSGIVVPPHGMVVQDLDKLLHSAKAVALHVTTSTGRVVAAVRQTTSQSKAGGWLPVAAEPATSEVIAGLPASGGARELYITVPGGRSARVKVTAITPRGSYQPTGGSSISLLPKLTAAIALPSLAGSAASIEITSNVPVTAALELPGGPDGAPGALAAGSAAVTGQGVIAASPDGSAGSTDLVLSAPGGAARVRIGEAGPGVSLTGQAGQVVPIPAKSSVEVKITLPKHGPKAPVIAIIVTPLAGSGPVYGARLAGSGGTLRTVLPLLPSPARVGLPYVRDSLTAVLGP